MLPTEPYLSQHALWPTEGRHILACHDDETVVVYQAYRPVIGEYAARHQRFGGEFSLSRMSWIKPNFLWMMYRSGWGTKEGQEVTLAVRLRRAFFDEILRTAVPSSFDGTSHGSREAWRDAVRSSEVRLQWDPDHDPTGRRSDRRAIQLGLRGRTLRRYAEEEPLEILDLSGFVAEQRSNVGGSHAGLSTPRERVYRPKDPTISQRLGLDVT